MQCVWTCPGQSEGVTRHQLCRQRPIWLREAILKSEQSQERSCMRQQVSFPGPEDGRGSELSPRSMLRYSVHEVRTIGEESTYRAAWDPTRRKDLPQSAGADCWETGIRSKGLISIARRAARREERSENCLRGMTLVAMRAAMGVMMAVSGSNAYKVLKQLYITRRV
jgi:hypothetical protein